MIHALNSMVLHRVRESKCKGLFLQSMGIKPFQFKHFTVGQDGITHKVGTDGVLLGAWVNVRQNEKFVLDIGTGSGLIALMMAQRTPPETRIAAVEIEAADVLQARENVAGSPWRDKISVHHTPVQDFRPGKKFDLIITNPPYFMKSLTPPDEKRSRARHNQTLGFDDLLDSVSQLLTKNGRLAIILPYAEGQQFLALARQVDLMPLRKTTFRARAQKPVERLLMELAYEGVAEPDAELILYKEGETWSSEYRRLMRDFYLDG